MRVQVKDFMSSPVLTVTEHARVGEVRSLLNARGIHAVPVVEEMLALPENQQSLKGIVSSADLSEGIADDILVGTVMSKNVHILHKDSSAKSAAGMMLKKKVHHLVVMEEGEIVGMVSSLDFVKLVSQYTLD